MKTQFIFDRFALEAMMTSKLLTKVEKDQTLEFKWVGTGTNIEVTAIAVQRPGSTNLTNRDN